MVDRMAVVVEKEETELCADNNVIMERLLSRRVPRSKVIDDLVDSHYTDMPQCDYSADIDYLTSTTTTTSFHSHDQSRRDFFEQQLQSLSNLLAEITPPTIDDPTLLSSPELRFESQKTES
eukprot:GHVS01083539.1.p1 GENE.GHVS01083539.1~~GHVS01083539.1.p1  ORF type:complete len:121 (+),score=24.67 GHVS01083539.1:631-993(+)